ncbi:hypothetical protein CEP45_03520 [Mergibacter septicus]|uniref:ESPR-type extended signal peptide-containing protein n=1 Tax=Mergibacter septicus TaxID=221402 RepID=UPI001C77E987|nr:YadA-like family protein [Mergibacter septicus]QDJ12972.1 hypothetical protein CEP45_03520 [Mergibacter septicus]
MNKIFKVIYNKALGVFMAVSELASGQGKERSSQIKRADSKKSLTRQSFPFTLSLLSFSLFLNLVPHTAYAEWLTMALGNISTGGSNSGTNLKFRNSVALNPQNEDSFGVSDSGSLSQGSVAVGYQAKAQGGNAVAVGRSTNAQGGQATAIGHRAGANGQAIALGADVYAWGLGSIALGGDDLVSNNNSSTKYRVNEGGALISSDVAIRKYGLKFPDPTIFFNRLYNNTAGINPFFSNQRDFLQSYGNKDYNNDKQDRRIFSPTFAGGRGAIAIGSRSIALGATSTALGALSFGLSDESTAVGFLSFVDVGAPGGIAVGRNSRVFSGNSVSVGNLTEAAATGSMAYGYDAKAVGEGSIAIGREVAANAYFDTDKTGDLVNKYDNLNSTINMDDASSNLSSAFSTFDSAYASYFTSGNDGNNTAARSSLPLWNESKVYFSIGDTEVKKTMRFRTANNGIVIGNRSFAVKKNTIALGYAALADADNSFAFGSYSSVQAGGANSSAIGVGAYVSGRFGKNSDQPNSTAVGTFAAVKGSQNSFAGGAFTSVSGSPNSVALGAYAKIQNSNDNSSITNNIAFGYKAVTSASNSVVIGAESIINKGAMNSIAFGSKSQVYMGASNSIAFGSNSTVKENISSSLALGNKAEVSLNNSVALGYQSTTTYLYVPQTDTTRASKKTYSPVIAGTPSAESAVNLPGYIPVGSSYSIPVDNSAGVISVGGWERTLSNGMKEVGLRRIINVAPGALDTDVATVGQLRALEFTKTEPNVVYYTIDSSGQKIKLVYNGSNFYPVDTTNGEPLDGAAPVELNKVLIGPKNPNAKPLADGSSVSVLSGVTDHQKKKVTPLGDALPFGNISSIVVSSGQNHDRDASTKNTAVITPTYLYLGAATNDAGTNAKGDDFGIKLNGKTGEESINVGKGSDPNLYINKDSIQSWMKSSSQGTGFYFDGSKITLRGKTTRDDNDNNTTRVIFDGKGTEAGLVVRFGDGNNSQGLLITSNKIQGRSYNGSGVGTDLAGIAFSNAALTLQGSNVQIKSLADGTDDKDAVNVSQLKQLASKVKDILGSENGTGISLGNDQLSFTASNIGGTGKSTVSQAIKKLNDDIKDAKLSYKANDDRDKKQVKLTDGLVFNKSNNNLTLSVQNNGQVTYGLSDNISVTKVTAGSNSVLDGNGLAINNASGHVTIGQTTGRATGAGLQIAANGIQSYNTGTVISGFTFNRGSIDLTGENAASNNQGVKITNVAKGSNDRDAVNYGQLKSAANSLIGVLGSTFTKTDTDGNITFNKPTPDSSGSGGIGDTGQDTIEGAIKWLKTNAGGKFKYKVNTGSETETTKLHFVANTDTGDTTGNIQITDKSGGKVQFALNNDISVSNVTASNTITVGTTTGRNNNNLEITGNSIQAKSNGQVTSGFTFNNGEIKLVGTNANTTNGVKLTNVADGSKSKDAVNYGQLESVKNTADQAKQKAEQANTVAQEAKQESNEAKRQAGQAVQIANQAKDTATQADNKATQANTKSEQAVAKATEADQKATRATSTADMAKVTANEAKTTADHVETEVNKGYTFQANSGDTQNLKLGGTVKLTTGAADDNTDGSNLAIKLEKSDNTATFTIGIKKAPTFESVTVSKDGKTSVLNENGLQINDPSGHVTIGKTNGSTSGEIGLDITANSIQSYGAGTVNSGFTFNNKEIKLTGNNVSSTNTGVKITNVARGTTNTDAVNYSQLSKLADDLKTVLGSNFGVSKDDGTITLTAPRVSDGTGGIGGTGKTSVNEAIDWLRTNSKFKYKVNTDSSEKETQVLHFVANDETGNDSGNIKITDLNDGKVKFELNNDLSVTTVTAKNSNASTKLTSTGLEHYSNSMKDGSISFGSGAITFSNGTSDGHIKLSGVADAEQNNDAVNLSQLKGLADKVKEILGDGINKSQDGLSFTGTNIGGTGKDTVAGAIKDINDKLTNTKLHYKANDNGDQQVELSKGLNFKAGDNLTASAADNGQVTYSLNNNISVTQVTAGSNGKTSVLDQNGLAINNPSGAISIGNTGPNSTKLQLTSNGIQLYTNSGTVGSGFTFNTGSIALTGENTKITNLTKGTDSNDAVNVSQLDKLAKSIKTVLGGKVNTTNSNGDITVTAPAGGSEGKGIGGTDATTVDGAIAEVLQKVKDNQAGLGSTTITYKANDSTSSKTVSLSQGFNFTNDDNGNIKASVADSGVVKFSLNKEITVEKVTAGKDDQTSVLDENGLAISNPSGVITIGATSSSATSTNGLQVTASSIQSYNAGVPTSGFNFASGKINLTGTNVNAMPNAGIQIGNVAKGSDDKDAVNVSQLYETVNALKNVLGDSFTTKNENGNITVTAPENSGDKNGIGGTGKTKIDEAIQEVNSNLNKGYTFKANGNSEKKLNLGGTVNLVAGDGSSDSSTEGTNLAIKLNGDSGNTATFTIGIKKDPSFNTVKVGNGSGAHLYLDGTSITAKNGGTGSTQKSAITFDSNEIKVFGSSNDATAKITNVKDGDVSAASKDAITGKQLYNLADSIKDILGKGSVDGSGKVVINGNKIGGTDSATVDGAIMYVLNKVNTAQLYYRADNGEKQHVSLTEGLQFVGDPNLTPSVEASGKIKYALNTKLKNLEEIKFKENGTKITSSDIIIGEKAKLAQDKLTIGADRSLRVEVEPTTITAFGSSGTANVKLDFDTTSGKITLSSGSAQKVTLTGLKKGKMDNDAVNFSQLYHVASQLYSVLGDDITLTDNKSGDISFTIKNNGANGGIGGTGKNTFTQAIKEINDKVKTGYKIAGNANNMTTDLPLSSELYILAGDINGSSDSKEFVGSNLKTKFDKSDNKGTLTIGLKEKPTFKEITVADDMAKTVLGKDGITYYNGDNASTPKATIKFGDEAITLSKGNGSEPNMPIKLKGVADGELKTDSKDALNAGQLYTSLQNILGSDGVTLETNDNGGLKIKDTTSSEGMTGGIGGSGKNTVSDAIKEILTKIKENQDNLGKTKLTYKVSGGGHAHMTTLSDGLEFINGKNLSVKAEDKGKITYSLMDDLQELSSIEFTSSRTDADPNKIKIKISKDESSRAKPTLKFSQSSNEQSSVVLTGVADGQVNDTSVDAVSGKQLYSLADSIKTVLGGNAKVEDGIVKITNGGTSPNGIGGTGKNTVHQAIEEINNNLTNAQLYYYTDGSNGMPTSPKQHVKLTEGLHFKAGANLYTAVENNGQVTYGLKDQLTKIESISLKSNGVKIDSNGFSIGSNVKLGMSALTIGSGAKLEDNKLTIGADNSIHIEFEPTKITAFNGSGNTKKTSGLSFEENKISFTSSVTGSGQGVTLSNVKAGTDDKDAVNVSQLYTTTTKLQQVLGKDITVKNDNGDITFTATKAMNGTQEGEKTAGIGNTGEETISGAIGALLEKINKNATDAEFAYKSGQEGTGQDKTANGNKTNLKTKLKDGLTFQAGDNLNVKIEIGGKVTYGLNKAVTGLNSIGLNGNGGSSGKNATLTSEKLTFTNSTPTDGEVKTATFGDDGVTLDFDSTGTQPNNNSNHLVKVGKDGFSVKNGSKEAKLDGDSLTIGNDKGKHLYVGTDGITGFTDASNKTSGLKFDSDKISLVDKNGKDGSMPNNSSEGVTLTNLKKGNLAKDSRDASTVGQLYDLAHNVLGAAPVNGTQANFDTPIFTGATLQSKNGANGTKGKLTFKDAIQALADSLDKGYTFAGDNNSGSLPLSGTLKIKSADKVLTQNGVSFKGDNLYTDYQVGADNTATLYIGLSDTPTFSTVTAKNQLKVGNGTDGATLTSEKLTFTTQPTDGNKAKTATFGNDGVTLDFGGEPNNSNVVKVAKDGFSVKSGTKESKLGADKLTIGAKGSKHVEVGTDSITGFTNNSGSAKQTSGLKFADNKVSLIDNQGKDGSNGNSSQGVTLTNLKKGNLTGKTSSDATTVGQLYDLAETVLGIKPNTGGTDFETPKFTGKLLGDSSNNGGEKARTLKEAIQTIATSIDTGYTFAGDFGSNALPLGGTLKIKSAETTLEKNRVKYEGKNLYTKYEKGADNTATLYIGLSETPTFKEVTAENQLKVGKNGASGSNGKEAVLTSENLKFTNSTASGDKAKTATFGNDGVTLDFDGQGGSSMHNVKVGKDGFSIKDGTKESKLGADKLTIGAETGKHLYVGTDGITGFSNMTQKTAGIDLGTKDQIKFTNKNGMVTSGFDVGTENTIKLVNKDGASNGDGVTLTNLKKGAIAENSKDAATVGQLYNLADKVLGTAPASNSDSPDFMTPTFTGGTLGNGLNGKEHTFKEAIQLIANSIDTGYTFAGDHGKDALPLSGTLNIKSIDNGKQLQHAGATFKGENLYTDYQMGTDGKTATLYIGLSETPNFKEVTADKLNAKSQLYVGDKDGKGATLTNEKLTFSNPNATGSTAKTASYGDDGVTLEFKDNSTTTNVKVGKDGFSINDGSGNESKLGADKLTVGATTGQHSEVTKEGFFNKANGGTGNNFSITYDTTMLDGDKKIGTGTNGTNGESKAIKFGGNGDSTIRLTGLAGGSLAKDSTDAVTGGQVNKLLGDDFIKYVYQGGNSPFTDIKSVTPVNTANGKKPTITDKINDLIGVINQGYTYGANNMASEHGQLYLGASLYINDGDNITVGYTQTEHKEGKFTVSLNKAVTQLYSVGLVDSAGANGNTADLTAENLTFAKKAKGSNMAEQTAVFGNDGVTLTKGDKSVKVTEDGFSASNNGKEVNVAPDLITVGSKTGPHTELSPTRLVGKLNASQMYSGIDLGTTDKIKFVKSDGTVTSGFDVGADNTIKLVNKEGTTDTTGVTLTNVAKGKLSDASSSDAATAGQLYNLAKTVLGLNGEINPNGTFTEHSFTGDTLTGKGSLVDAIQTIANSIDKGYTFAGDNGKHELPLSGTLNIKSADSDLTKEGVTYKGSNLYTDYQFGTDKKSGTLYIGLSDTPTFNKVTAKTQLYVGNSDGKGATLTNEKLTFNTPSANSLEAKTATYGNDGVTLDFDGNGASSSNIVKVAKDGFSVKDGAKEGKLGADRLAVGTTAGEHAEVTDKGFFLYSNGTQHDFAITKETSDSNGQTAIKFSGKDGAPIVLGNLAKGKLTGKESKEATTVGQLYDLAHTVLGLGTDEIKGTTDFTAPTFKYKDAGMEKTVNNFKDAITSLFGLTDKGYKFSDGTNEGQLSLGSKLTITTVTKQDTPATVGLANSTMFNGRNLYINYDSSVNGEGKFTVGLKDVLNLSGITFDKSADDITATIESGKGLVFSKGDTGSEVTTTFADDGVTLNLDKDGTQNVKLAKDGFSIKANGYTSWNKLITSTNGNNKEDTSSKLEAGVLTLGASNANHTQIGADWFAFYGNNGSTLQSGFNLGMNKITLLGTGANGSEKGAPVLLTNLARGAITATSTDAITGAQLYDALSTLTTKVLGGVNLVHPAAKDATNGGMDNTNVDWSLKKDKVENQVTRTKNMDNSNIVIPSTKETGTPTGTESTASTGTAGAGVGTGGAAAGSNGAATAGTETGSTVTTSTTTPSTDSGNSGSTMASNNIPPATTTDFDDPRNQRGGIGETGASTFNDAIKQLNDDLVDAKITYTANNGGKGERTDDKVVKDGYKADGANPAYTTKLTNGLSFNNGKNTTASVAKDGNVSYSLNSELDLKAIVFKADDTAGKQTHGMKVSAEGVQFVNVTNANGTENKDKVTINEKAPVVTTEGVYVTSIKTPPKVGEDGTEPQTSDKLLDALKSTLEHKEKPSEKDHQASTKDSGANKVLNAGDVAGLLYGEKGSIQQVTKTDGQDQLAVVNEAGKATLMTHNAGGNDVTYHDNVSDAIYKLNTEGTKYQHVNGGAKVENSNISDDSSAQGAGSLAIGVGSNVSGDHSSALGYRNTVTGTNSGVFGSESDVNGNNTYVMVDPSIINTDKTYGSGHDVYLGFKDQADKAKAMTLKDVRDKLRVAVENADKLVNINGVFDSNKAKEAGAILQKALEDAKKTLTEKGITDLTLTDLPEVTFSANNSDKEADKKAYFQLRNGGNDGKITGGAAKAYGDVVSNYNDLINKTKLVDDKPTENVFFNGGDLFVASGASNTVVMGSKVTVEKAGTVAIGNELTTNSANAIAIGTKGVVSGENSGSIGGTSNDKGNNVNADSSYTIGNGNSIGVSNDGLKAAASVLTSIKASEEKAAKEAAEKAAAEKAAAEKAAENPTAVANAAPNAAEQPKVEAKPELTKEQKDQQRVDELITKLGQEGFAVKLAENDNGEQTKPKTEKELVDTIIKQLGSDGLKVADSSNVNTIAELATEVDKQKDTLLTSSATQNVFAIGNNVMISGKASGAVALGSNTVVTNAMSGAVGYGAVATLTTAELQTQVAADIAGEFVQQLQGVGKDVIGEISFGKAGAYNPMTGKVEGTQTRRLTNIAAGVNPTDAVNVSQLRIVNNQVQANKHNLAALRAEFDQERSDLRAGIAGALATAGLPTVNVAGRSTFSVAGGSYRGQNAVAFGISKVSDNGRIIIKVTGNSNSRGNLGGSIGAGFVW